MKNHPWSISRPARTIETPAFLAIPPLFFSSLERECQSSIGSSVNRTHTSEVDSCSVILNVNSGPYARAPLKLPLPLSNNGSNGKTASLLTVIRFPAQSWYRNRRPSSVRSLRHSGPSLRPYRRSHFRQTMTVPKLNVLSSRKADLDMLLGDKIPALRPLATSSTSRKTPAGVFPRRAL